MAKKKFYVRRNGDVTHDDLEEALFSGLNKIFARRRIEIPTNVTLTVEEEVEKK